MKKQNTYSQTVWNENTIRREMARLDAITGLHDASLPISFNDAKYTLGMFCSANGGAFCFSNCYFLNPDWPVEKALDTIRHEYAHYMERKLYGYGGHGSTWKHCCRVIGAIPERYYKADRPVSEMKKTEQYDPYRAGNIVVHPRFGDGVIDKITGEGANCSATVNFKTMGVKTVPLAWLIRNCRRVS